MNTTLSLRDKTRANPPPRRGGSRCLALAHGYPLPDRRRRGRTPAHDQGSEPNPSAPVTCQRQGWALPGPAANRGFEECPLLRGSLSACPLFAPLRPGVASRRWGRVAAAAADEGLGVGVEVQGGATGRAGTGRGVAWPGGTAGRGGPWRSGAWRGGRQGHLADYKPVCIAADRPDGPRDPRRPASATPDRGGVAWRSRGSAK